MTNKTQNRSFPVIALDYFGQMLFINVVGKIMIASIKVKTHLYIVHIVRLPDIKMLVALKMFILITFPHTIQNIM